MPQLLPVIPEKEAPGIKPIKQVELYKKFRKYVPDKYKDTHYAAPDAEVVAEVKGDKKEKAVTKKQKLTSKSATDASKNTGKPL